MLKRINKKAMALLFAFAFAISAVFTYAPLTAEAAPEDLAIGFVKNHTITKPYYNATTIVENKDDGRYRVTKLLVQCDYPLAGYVYQDDYFDLIAYNTGSMYVFGTMEGQSTYGSDFTSDNIDMLFYEQTTYGADHEILEQNSGLDAFIAQHSHTSYERAYMSFHQNNNYKVYSNGHIFTEHSNASTYAKNIYLNINHSSSLLSKVSSKSVRAQMHNAALFDYNNYTISTQTAPTSYNVDASLIGEGALVTVPANMDLVYDEASGNYIAGDYISARGHVLDIAEVVVKTDKTATYQLNGTRKEYEADVTFGTEEEGQNVAVWSSSDLAQGYTNAENAIKKAIGISLPGENITWSGDYSSQMEVNVGYNIIGLYRDICAPTTEEGYTAFLYSNNDCNTTTAKAFLVNNGDDVSTVNLSGLSLKLNTGVTERNYSKFLIVPQKADYTTDISSNDIVTKMQLTSASGNIFYCADLTDVADPMSLESWAEDFDNLQILVIPADIASNQLTSKANGLSTTLNNYTNTCFTGTENVIGNALSFVKGKTEGGFYKYIPYIVYRGTMDEWKALSGSEDWVFGNAANAVTVQCSDGRLLYN